MPSKACMNCGITKPLTEFYAHPMMSDGHLNSCKECRKNYARQHRLANESVRIRERARSKTLPRKAHLRANSKRWRADNPVAYHAHSAVAYAVRTGRLTREPCTICGTTVGVHAHHRDYAKPLDVTWLCAKCHSRLHVAFPELAGLHKAP